jgi:phosphatidylserine/phosphatidylglycerophosphate/cardiolipin synthase-like enzyme
LWLYALGGGAVAALGLVAFWVWPPVIPPPPPPPGRKYPRTLNAHDHNLLSEISSEVDDANSSILVACYLFTHLGLSSRLIAARHGLRKVTDIRVVLDANTPLSAPFGDDFNPRRINSSVANKLLASGIPVRGHVGGVFNHPGKLHCKGMIVDKVVKISGSANFTHAAFGKNHEEVVISKDSAADFAARNSLAFFEELWESSTPWGELPPPA